MTETHEDLGGRLSLRALIGLFARASLHVGNDSGPAHIARAVAPAAQALGCGDCHDNAAFDFEALGYTCDPMTGGAGCGSRH